MVTRLIESILSDSGYYTDHGVRLERPNNATALGSSLAMPRAQRNKLRKHSRVSNEHKRSSVSLSILPGLLAACLPSAHPVVCNLRYDSELTTEIKRKPG